MSRNENTEHLVMKNRNTGLSGRAGGGERPPRARRTGGGGASFADLDEKKRLLVSNCCCCIQAAAVLYLRIQIQIQIQIQMKKVNTREKRLLVRCLQGEGLICCHTSYLSFLVRHHIFRPVKGTPKSA